METDTANLVEIIDQKTVLAKTKRFDLSFNELLDMYSNRELDIRPAFQRIFVWDIIKQSQFIESLLLDLPVPPIYVVEVEEGRYVLVDGLQRLSSYLHFRGVLDNKHKKIVTGQTFALDGCDIATELNGKQWKDLDTALQIRLKRAFVSVQVIRKESDQDLKFHMFKRLNDGGTPVSPQQVRNCVIRMLKHGDRLMDFVNDLAKYPSYLLCCAEALTEEQENAQFDQELVLRFLALRSFRLEFKHDVGRFIDGVAENIARNGDQVFDYASAEAAFKRTFDILAKSTGIISFTFPTKTGKLTTGFSAYHFEGVTLGLQPFLEKLNPDDSSQMEELAHALTTARVSPEFRDVSTGGGRNSSGLLKRRVETIETAVASMLNSES